MMKFRSARLGTPIRKRGGVRALLAAGAAVGLGVVVTLAAYTDNASFTAQFSAGNLDLTMDTAQDGPSNDPYVFDTWKDLKLKPGTEVHATLQVNNAGNLPFTYTMGVPTFASGDGVELQGAMVAGIRIVTGTDCTPASYEASNVTVATEAPLDKLKFDAPRSLDVKESERLCFMASLPDSEDVNATQGQSVHPVFTFSATQS